jgi:hypothetical protein
MSFFKNIFEVLKIKNESNIKMDWEPLKPYWSLDEIIADRKINLLFFKHSTRCSISRMALKQFENEFDFPEK